MFLFMYELHDFLVLVICEAKDKNYWWYNTYFHKHDSNISHLHDVVMFGQTAVGCELLWLIAIYQATYENVKISNMWTINSK